MMAMKWIGKVAGGLLGGLVLGPLGAALGVLVGHQFDEHSEVALPPLRPEELAAIGERFFRATFRVMGCLAKADGRVSELEIAVARSIMDELRLNEPQVREAIACFTAGKSSDFELDAELAALARACHGRPELTRVFLEIQVRAALAGNNVEGPVRPLLQHIARSLEISALEFAHVEAVLRIQRGAFRTGRPGGAHASTAAAGGRQLQEAYRVLESSPGASDAELAKAYRRQLQRHHPDKLKANGLPESMLAHAKQRTQQIIEAWELIRARRGIR
jgi:DnaJ like chaperone protein